MSYKSDREMADKFLTHQAEIARSVIRIEVAPIEEDLRHNTDLILRSLPSQGRPVRFSARVRRRHQLRYLDEFTVRYRRPSGVATEWHKMRAGDGDYFIYGFDSGKGPTPCATCGSAHDRMHPWFIGNLAILNDWIRKGGRPKKIKENTDDSSDFAPFSLDLVPLGFIVNSEGHPLRHFIPPPAGLCHRWLSQEQQWCASAPIGEWQVGPLCAQHAPVEEAS